MNKTILIGNLVRNPETDTFSNGSTATKFTVASNRKYNKEKTDFFHCTAFGKLGTDVIQKYATKGQKVFVLGRMESDVVEKDNSKITYWNLVVDEFSLLSSSGKSAEEYNVAPLDLEAVDENLPF